MNSRYTVKPVLSGHSRTRPKIVFQDRLSLNAGQKYCTMLQESILQYFRPSLSYNLSLRPLFCLFLGCRLTQILLYSYGIKKTQNGHTIFHKFENSKVSVVTKTYHNLPQNKSIAASSTLFNDVKPNYLQSDLNSVS